LPAQHNLGALKPLEEREQRGSCDSRPGLALRRPTAIEHASLEFLAGLAYHSRRVERIVVELRRDSHDGKPAEKYVGLTTQRSKSPAAPQGAFSRQTIGCRPRSRTRTQHSCERTIGRQRDGAAGRAQDQERSSHSELADAQVGHVRAPERSPRCSCSQSNRAWGWSLSGRAVCSGRRPPRRLPDRCWPSNTEHLAHCRAWPCPWT
jgi:hypothetical protein